MTTDIEAIAACGRRIAELEAENHDLSVRITASGVRSREDEAYDSGYQAAKADDEQRVYKAEAERDALRTVLTPSQRKRFDAQWQPREEGER